MIALIAAALIIGGVLFVKNRAEQARRAEAVKIAQQQAEDQAADQATSSSDDESEADNGAGTTSNSDESEPVAPAAQPATELPTTGPENSVLQLVAVTMLVMSSSLYLASRKAVRVNL